MLNYRTIIFALSVCFLLVSCNGNTDLTSDELILEHFSKNEANNLQEIHEFFTREICTIDDTDNSSQASCYEEFLDYNDKELPSSDPNIESIRIKDPIRPGRQVEFFEKLDTNLFDEIWIRHYYKRDDSTTTVTIGIKSSGRYIDFLAALGNEYESIEQYKNNIISDSKLKTTDGRVLEGFMTMKTQKHVLNNPDEFDVHDVKIRLVLAIHYLTLFYDKEV